MKNSNQTIIVIGGLVLGLIVCLVCALSISIFGLGLFSSNPTSNNKTQTIASNTFETKKYSINEVVEIDDVEIEILTVDKNYTPSNRNFNPSLGAKLVVIDLTIKNNRTQPLSISPVLNFKIQNENNKKFSIVQSDKNPSLNSVIDTGKNSRGFLTFEVDAESKDLDLIYNPDFMSSESVVIKL